MKFSEFVIEREEFDLGEKQSLNSKIWSNNHIKPEVRKALLNITKEFEKFMDVKGLKVVDVVLTGSIANYTWHSQSDIDLHLVVNIDKEQCKDDLSNLFTAKKNLWNLQHTLSIKGFPVELYVQDQNEPHVSSGVYSLQDKKWIAQPKKVHPSIDDSYVIRKADEWKERIDSLIAHRVTNQDTIDKMKKRLRDFRKMGLDQKGEFAVENLAFKILRNDGYIDKLYDYAVKAEDNKLSI